MMHSYENRTWRTERRRAWPRILGWVVAVIPFILLMAAVFYGEWFMEYLRKLQ